MKANTIDDFWAKVDQSNPTSCWIWQGTKDPKGYGHFRLDGKIRSAHRLAYELLVGPIPDGWILHHICENPSCVRAGEHVIPVERHTHTVDLSPRTVAAQYAGGGSCKHGHPFDENNTRIAICEKYPNGHARRCRTCERLRLNGWERQRRSRQATSPAVG